MKIRGGLDDSRKVLVAKSTRLDGDLTAADFGDPLDGANHLRVCLYDSVGGVSVLRAGFTLAGGGDCGSMTCWRPLGDSGFVYRDRTASRSGITKFMLMGGSAGRGKILLAAKGEALPLPEPSAADRYFDVDTTWTIQISESSVGNCWQSTFESSDVRRNDGVQFKAVYR